MKKSQAVRKVLLFFFKNHKTAIKRPNKQEGQVATHLRDDISIEELADEITAATKVSSLKTMGKSPSGMKMDRGFI
jgi:hypothetical protein